MPKIPGRESTRLVVPIDQLLVHGFVFPWDRAVDKKRCIVEGCDHWVAACIMTKDGPGPSYAVHEWDWHHKPVNQGPVRQGYACECCTVKILDQMESPPKAEE